MLTLYKDISLSIHYMSNRPESIYSSRSSTSFAKFNGNCFTFWGFYSLGIFNVSCWFWV